MLAPAVRHRTQVPTVRSSSLSSGDHRRTNNGTESTCHTTKSSIWAWTTTTSPGFGPSTVPRPGNASESGCWTEHYVNSHGQSKGVASRRMIRQAGENVPASLLRRTKEASKRYPFPEPAVLGTNQGPPAHRPTDPRRRAGRTLHRGGSLRAQYETNTCHSVCRVPSLCSICNTIRSLASSGVSPPRLPIVATLATLFTSKSLEGWWS